MRRLLRRAVIGTLFAGCGVIAVLTVLGERVVKELKHQGRI